MNLTQTLETILHDGFILVFNQDELDIVNTARALIDAGINNMELTLRISRPLEKMRRLKKDLPTFLFGAASLLDTPEVLHIYNRDHPDDPLPAISQTVQAGASYLVSPLNFLPETFDDYAGKLPLIPGCASATEVIRQFAMGANLCKIFPARQLGGPHFIKSIDPALHKTISLVPTGGTTMDNIPDYISAGILVLGGSFNIIDKTTMQTIIREQDYSMLAREFARIKNRIDKLRAEKWPDLDFRHASLAEISRITGRNFNLPE